MGTKAKQIVKMKIDELIASLNKALADEWLAYYQYWVCAKIAKGPMRPDVVEQLEEHADEELKHADMLAERIAQLGGEPVLSPAEWEKVANCKYIKPSNPHVKGVLKDTIAGERCAIEIYQKMMDDIQGKDDLTYFMLAEILKDEIEHENDLEMLLEDIG